MRSNENQRMRFHRAPENNNIIGFIDLVLFVVGFMLIAMVVKGTWQFAAQLSMTEIAGALLSCAFGVFFFWCFEMYSVVLLKPSPTIVTAILSAIYTFICAFLILLLFTHKADYLLFLALGNLLSYFFLCIWRIALYYYHKNRSHRQKMLMIEKLKDDNSRVRRMKYACMSRFDAWYEQVDVENKERVQEFIETRFLTFTDAILRISLIVRTMTCFTCRITVLCWIFGLCCLQAAPCS